MNTEIQFEVGKGKSDLDVFHVVLDGAEVGACADGPADDPDFTLAMPRDVFASVLSGDLTLDVGYMQGSVKLTGNVGRMLSVLPVLTGDDLIRTLSARTP